VSDDDRTASTIVLVPILAQLAREGGDVTSILRETGLALDDLLNHELRVPEGVHLRVWKLASAGSRDPYFGLQVARHAKLGTYDVLDYAAHWSVNLEDALQRVVRFHRLLSDSSGVEVRAGTHTITVRRSSPPSSVDPQECDNFFALIVLRANVLLARPLNLGGVRFSHAAPPDTTRYREVFGLVPSFGEKTNEVVFRRRDLKAKASSPNAGLARLLDRYAAEMLARLPPLGDVVARLRFAIMRTLSSGRLTLQSVARLERKSPRTLQRELRARGTSYRELLEEVRREAALELLKKSAASITEVAFLVGFASTAGFHRVFRGWTGKTPEQFRHGFRSHLLPSNGHSPHLLSVPRNANGAIGDTN